MVCVFHAYVSYFFHYWINQFINYLFLHFCISKRICFHPTYQLLCLFWKLVPLENFSLIWRRHHCRWRAAIFDLCSALMAIEQWGFLNVPHLLRHVPTVYNGHLRGSVTLTPDAERDAERLAVNLSLSVLRT